MFVLLLNYEKKSINRYFVDANKIGQKLMEKMGWSRGKGLGKNEDGIVENLKVSYKNDSKGRIFDL